MFHQISVTHLEIQEYIMILTVFQEEKANTYEKQLKIHLRESPQSISVAHIVCGIHNLLYRNKCLSAGRSISLGIYRAIKVWQEVTRLHHSADKQGKRS